MRPRAEFFGTFCATESKGDKNAAQRYANQFITKILSYCLSTLPIKTLQACLLASLKYKKFCCTEENDETPRIQDLRAPVLCNPPAL